MKFGEVAIDEAAGDVLAHSVRAAEAKFAKGRRLTAEDVETLRSIGITSVIAARLDPGDLMEDEAASRLAAAVSPDHLRLSPAATGRVNFFASVNGLFRASREIVDGFNRVDPAITLACLADRSDVKAGDMVATIKIIPLAVAGSAVERAVSLLADGSAFAVKPYRAHRVALVATELPSLKPSVMDKTRAILEARLSASGSSLAAERRVPHRTASVAEALRALAADHDMLIVFGASAVADADDVIPAAIRAAGGEVEQVGLPVDPGNLLVLGHIGKTAVIGAPGCARSPKENGFDWVLDRLIAGLDVADTDIAGLGVGGLLMEIPTRPQPREAPVAKPRAPRVDAVVLAAGRSSRMGGPNKLLALFDGKPLVRRAAEAVLASRAGEVIVVTGHQEGRVAAALSGLAVRSAHNGDYASGLASSLKAGFRARAREADGMLVMLGDMPGVTSADLDRLIAAFVKAGGTAIVRATFEGRRGNPVILPRSLFGEVMKLEGDTGARHIVEAEGNATVDVEIGAGAAVDVDTPEAMQRAGGVLQG